MIQGLNPKIEQYRIQDHLEGWFNSDSTYGNNGFFRLPVGGNGQILLVLASDGAGWEHVSVSVKTYDGIRYTEVSRCPTWEEMGRVKDLFWGPEECVMQLHPPRSRYVNCHPFALHLWKPVGIEIPQPPPILVGLKSP